MNTIREEMGSAVPPLTSQRVHFEVSSPAVSCYPIDEGRVQITNRESGRLPSSISTGYTSVLPFNDTSSRFRYPNPANASAASSFLHYADTNLSTELLRVLNRSDLDPGQSGAGSVLGASLDHSILSSTSEGIIADDDDALERNAHRQVR